MDLERFVDIIGNGILKSPNFVKKWKRWVQTGGDEDRDQPGTGNLNLTVPRNVKEFEEDQIKIERHRLYYGEFLNSLFPQIQGVDFVWNLRGSKTIVAEVEDVWDEKEMEEVQRSITKYGKGGWYLGCMESGGEYPLLYYAQKIEGDDTKSEPLHYLYVPDQWEFYVFNPYELGNSVWINRWTRTRSNVQDTACFYLGPELNILQNHFINWIGHNPLEVKQ